MKMTVDRAFDKFGDAVEVDYGTKKLSRFYKKIWLSDLPPQEKNFFLCLCNDFEDIKREFYLNVQNFLEENYDGIDRQKWLNYWRDILEKQNS